MAPLGHETRDLVEEEAERIRTIFRGYLQLGSLNRLMADLRKRGIVTKVRSLKTGRTIGGIPFTRGPLAHLLRNRFYVGEVAFKDNQGAAYFGSIENDLSGAPPPVIAAPRLQAAAARGKRAPRWYTSRPPG
jgi:hypothetical protein